MAMSAWGEAKPNATRVRTPILVLVDSTRALEVPERRAASMGTRWRRILRPSSTEAGIWQRAAQASQWPSRAIPSSPLVLMAGRSSSSSSYAR